MRFAEIMCREYKEAKQRMRAQIQNARKCCEHNSRHLSKKQLKKINKHLSKAEEVLDNDWWR